MGIWEQPHAEVGVIQQVYEKGMTNGKDMFYKSRGESFLILSKRYKNYG
jgi:hypothetical protein